MRFSLLFIFTIGITHSIFSQKEIFFDNTPKDSVKVKELKGVEIGYTGTSSFTYKNFVNLIIDKNFNEEFAKTLNLNTFYFNYFKEKRLLNSISLLTQGGFCFTYLPLYNYSSISYLGLTLSAEPRWYYNFYKRYRTGKCVNNNGSFLALPIEFFSYTRILKSNNSQDYIKVYLSPQWGFRKSISNHLIFETIVGGSISTNDNLLGKTNNGFKISPLASLRIGYLF
jgi:hypothetical protein